MRNGFWLVPLFLSSIDVQAQTAIDSLIHLALTNNPALHAFGHQVEAARADIAQAGAWDPPQIGVDFFQVPVSSFPFPTKRVMEVDYFVRQTIPWPGKKRIMTGIANQSAKMKHYDFSSMELDIVHLVKTLYYDLYLVDRKLEINRESRLLVQSLLLSALRRVEVGRGRQSDVFQLQSQGVRLDNDSLMLRAERFGAESELNSVLNRLASTPIKTEDSLLLPPVNQDESSLIERALASRPELKTLESMELMFREEKRLASREAYPDIMVGGMLKNMSNTSKDFWSVMVGIDLPIAWWSRGKYQGKVQSSDQHIRHAQMERAAVELEIASSVRKTLIRRRLVAEQAENCRSKLIPLAQQAIDAVKADYETGRATLNEVLEKRNDLLMNWTEYHELLVSALKSEADLERLLGLKSDRLVNKENHHD